jgi:DNA-binding LytR/AlgR family response regulator
MVDIEVAIDEKYVDPKVTILTREKTGLVESIINAIENVSENEFPLIPAYTEGEMEFVSQRDILRVYIQDRKCILQTDEGLFSVRKNLSRLEEDLNPSRFVRISQSEIINIYKVKRFDINIAGTIGVEFENGTKTWASRSCVKTLKALLK